MSLSSMQFSKQTEWLEIFVCDIGPGILFHSDKWIDGDLPQKLKRSIKRNLDGKYPLGTIGPKLFVTPLSRYTNRHDEYRTKLTGLQAIAKTIRTGGAHIRVTDGVEGFGNKYPWSPETIGTRFVDIDWNSPIENRDALGTFMHLAVQPFDEFQDTETYYLKAPNQVTKDRIKQSLLARNPETAPVVEFVDRRFQPKIRPTQIQLEKLLERNTTGDVQLIVRLPKRASKQDLCPMGI